MKHRQMTGDAAYMRLVRNALERLVAVQPERQPYTGQMEDIISRLGEAATYAERCATFERAREEHFQSRTAETAIYGAPLPERQAQERPALDLDAYYAAEQDDPEHPYGYDGHEHTGGDA